MPEIKIVHKGDMVMFISDAFAWRVCLDVEGETCLTDNCFDLVPDVPYTVKRRSDLREPKVAALGNRFVL